MQLKTYLSKKLKGFSLIEIMIVVGLIAMLAAIGIPAYSSYVIKGKVSKALPVAREISSQMINEYNALGKFGKIIFSGKVIEPGVAEGVAINSGPVKGVAWDALPTSGNPRAYFSIYIADLSGVDGYVEPTGANGSKAALRFYVYLKNGSFKTACGKHTLDEATDIPLEFLPSGCKCTELKAAFDGDVEDTTCG